MKRFKVMAAHLIRRLTAGKTPLWILKLMGNLWMPFLGAGIKISRITPDYRHATVRLKYRWYNKNYVGTHFGGSIYAMTDPFYMLLMMNNLGRDYIVWDKAARIRFRKPGRSDLTADFELTEKEIEEVIVTLKTQEKMDWHKDILVKDAKGDVVAEIHKTLYISKKPLR